MHKIKKMNIKDYREIIGLWKSTEGIGINDYDDSRRSIKKFIEKNPNTCFVAVNDNEIIGTVMSGNDGRRGIIYHLMVKPEYRKNGIGKKLLDRAENGLRKEGIRRIYLFALKNNKTGNRFWANNDYIIRDHLVFRTRIFDKEKR